MKNLPKRSDPIYKEIEGFADYELTQCIAYEMAKRSNKNSRPQIEPRYRYKEKHKDLTKFKNGRNILTEAIPRVGYTIERKISFKDNNYNHINEYDLECETITDIESIESFCNIVREEQKEINEFNKRTSEAKTIDELMSLVNEMHRDDKRYSDLEIENNIIENFQREKLETDKLESRAIRLEVDLNKPLHEIIAYVTHIKKDFELNESILKAPIELLGEKLEQAGNLEILSKQERLADMFYIYDCLERKMTPTQIRNQVFNYNADNGNDTKTLDPKTFKKYKEIAVEYIDNARYKELITGVKIDQFIK